MKKGIHIMNPKKQNKYMSPYYFLFYIQWAYVESPKYKMICLKSPKSSEIAVFFKTNSGQKPLTMFISSCFNNYRNEF